MAAQLPPQQPPQAGQQQSKNDYTIRVTRKGDLKRWSILKFNQADNVDPSKWTASNEVFLEREDNKNIILSTQTTQEYGEGSEYGKAAREEARRKKYGRQARTYNLDHQPWHLSFTDNNGRERKFNSIREGDGHADYWIFMKVGDEFHATKVDEMHRFTPAIKHKTLGIDQAEEEFLKRDKVMNRFALKAQIMAKAKGDEEDEKLGVGTKGANLKIKDGYSSSDSGDEADDAEEGGGEKKKKKQKPQTKRKDKRTRVEDADDVAKYESSDGEDEGREYDYMTDSGSDSDREEVKVEEKMEKELVAVGDESGLKKMIDSDESDSDSNDDDIMRKILHGESERRNDDLDVEDRDSSGSDTDDDTEKLASAVLMPNIQKKDFPSTSNDQAKKRPAAPGEEGVPAKKPKPETNEGLNEETVRKYLRRKPHTTKELLAKFKGKCADMPKAEIVTRLAAILKAIEPHQYKHKQGKKDILFFSLGNQMPR